MKNLKFLVLLFLSASVLLSGCKKNDPDPELEAGIDGSIKTPTGKSCLLTKTKYGSDYAVFEYDSQNRPVKITYYENNVLDEYVTVTYSSTQVVVKEYSAGGQLEETSTYSASNGRITGSNFSDTWVENGVTYSETFQQSFEHNADGYLTKEVYSGSSSAGGAVHTWSGNTSYTYQNGNLISEVNTNGSSSSTITYEYYTDKANTLPGTDEDLLLTKANKNPVKKRTATYSQGGSQPSYSETTTYVYTYNEDGLIVKAVAEETSSQPGSTPSSYEEAFEYSCK